MAIKISLGKLGLTLPVQEFVRTHAERNGLGLLDVELAHVAMVETMPFHHRDPFDRLLIAQAQAEGLTIIGMDGVFDAYGVTREW